MIRLGASACVLVLLWLPLRAAPVPPVAAAGLAALCLAAAGIATLRRGPTTAAACVFLAEYAAAVWIADATTDVGPAAIFGLALLFLLQIVDIGRRARRAAVGGGVARSLAVRAVGVGAATAGATALATTLAGAAAASIPVTVAPLAAAAGTFGVVLALAVLVTSSARARAGAPAGVTSTLTLTETGRGTTTEGASRVAR